MITKLKPKQIFVFGSNLAGKHYGGAALFAYQNFGAELGIGEGLTGQCYAFPTLDKEFNKLSIKHIRKSAMMLANVCINNPDKEFLLTKVGCGIAGYNEEDIKAVFDCIWIKNLIKPEGWK